MKSPRTTILEKRLCELLIRSAEVERKSGITKQILEGIKEFEPCNLFWRIDRRSLQKISKIDLNIFLLENNITLSKTQLNLLFSYVDLDEDQMLNWKEFCRMVLSEQKEFKEDTRGQFKISHEVEESVIRVLKQEIEGISKLMSNIRRLVSCERFSAKRCFELIDVQNKGYFTAKSVYDFLTRVHGSSTVKRAQRIIMRLDRDWDNKVEMKEFEKLFELYNGVKQSMVDEDDNPRQLLSPRALRSKKKVKSPRGSIIQESVVEKEEKAHAPELKLKVRPKNPGYRFDLRNGELVKSNILKHPGNIKSSPSLLKDSIFDNNTVSGFDNAIITEVSSVQLKNSIPAVPHINYSEKQNKHFGKKIRTNQPAKFSFENSDVAEEVSNSIINGLKETKIRPKLVILDKSEIYPLTIKESIKENVQIKVAPVSKPPRSPLAIRVMGRNKRHKPTLDKQSTVTKSFPDVLDLEKSLRLHYEGQKKKLKEIENNRMVPDCDKEDKPTERYVNESEKIRTKRDRGGLKKNRRSSYEENIHPVNNFKDLRKNDNAHKQSYTSKKRSHSQTQKQKTFEKNLKKEKNVFERRRRPLTYKKEMSVSGEYSKYLVEAEKKEFLRLIEMIVGFFRKLEEVKRYLMDRSDFLPREFFSIATDLQNDSVRTEDLKFIFENLKIEFSQDELSYLIISFDLDEDGMLNYDEFCEMILPFSKKSRSKLLRRRETEVEYLEDYSIKTRKGIRDVFLTLIKIEEFVTNESNQIQDNLDKLVDKITKNKDGQTADIDDVADALADSGIDLTFRELNEVLDRFGM